MAQAKHTPIPGFDGYEISAEGEVVSNTNWRGYGRRVIGSIPNADGYPSVRLSVGGRRRHIAVHRLVALAYLPPRPHPHHHYELRHLDGDKTRPHASNLAWGTQAENAADRERHGRTSRGDRHALAIKAGIQASTNPFWRHAR